MRGAHKLWLLFCNFGDDLFNRGRRKRGLVIITAMICRWLLRGGHHGHALGNFALIKNLTPAIAKPPITNDKHIFLITKLARNRLHPIGPTTWYDDNAISLIDLFQTR